MRRPRPQELLDLVDEAAQQPPNARARTLLAFAFPEAEIDAETLGARNARLFALRRDLFGRHIACLSTCGACGEAMEFELDAEALASTPVRSGPITVEHGGVSLEFRTPQIRDIDIAARTGTPLRDLLAACLLTGEASELLEAADLQQRVSEAFDAADPLGVVAIETACPACGAHATPVLDPAELVWLEIASAARRLEEDVHILADAYGWGEAETLALPEPRRRRYVERLTS